MRLTDLPCSEKSTKRVIRLGYRVCLPPIVEIKDHWRRRRLVVKENTRQRGKLRSPRLQGAFEGAREPSVYGNDEKYDAVYKG